MSPVMLSNIKSLLPSVLPATLHVSHSPLQIAAWTIVIVPPTKVCLPAHLNYLFLFHLRRKGHQADLPDGGKKKTSSHLDTHIAPAHEMTSSRLPMLAEEETSDIKPPQPSPLVREEADGKDDVAEVKICKIGCFYITDKN